MADYIYLLRTRLTPAQQTALGQVHEAARDHAMTIFLVGGAVRDLTSGSPIRDLDLVVQGSVASLRKEMIKRGGVLIGVNDQTQSFYVNFPGGVRMEVGPALSAAYPKPNKPVFRPAGILEDLRRRDFTANAMAISLNEGSYGLLLDPLNGVADIENRELRLVSNYGFIEDPSRMVRAARFSARLGWQMEERTQQRYDTGKTEGYIETMTPAQRGYELEEVFHEEDPVRVLRRLEAEGWTKALFPAWTAAKANEADIDRLRDTVGQLEAMGIHPDPSPAFFPLLTAKLAPKEVTALKSSFARPGFVDQIAALEADTKTFAAQFSSKAAAAPSDAWKMLFATAPEPVLWLAHTTKSAPLQARFKAFFNDWPQARQKIPYQLMQEMRITPELPGYDDLLDRLFFAIMDEKLDTPEAAKAFLEPFSPPAPPPPVNLRRRAVKRETKAAKPRSKKDATELDLAAGEETSTPAPPLPAKAAPAQPAASGPQAGKAGGKPVSPVAAKQPTKTVEKQPAKSATKPSTKIAAGKTAKKTVKPASRPAAKKMPTKASAKPAGKKAPAKKVVAKGAAGARKTQAKTASKAPAKKPLKSAAKSKTGSARGHAPAKKAAKTSTKAAAKSQPKRKR